MLRAGNGRRTILNRLGQSPSFFLPLSDAGGGTVNINLAAGVGSGTFTRATTAWTKLSSGLWTSVASGAPRSFYSGLDTTAGSYAGYLAEGESTNECLQARTGTATHWIASNCTKAQNQTGIDGVTNSCFSLTGTAANGTVMQPIASTFTAAISRTVSYFMKRLVGTGDVAITLDGGTTYTTVTPNINASTFTMVQATQSLATATVGIKIVTSGDSIAVDMAQEEQATFASTPMPTGAATVTRNADVLTYQYAGNGNIAQGACYAELSTFWSTNGANNATAVYIVNSGRLLFLSGANLSTRISANDSTTTITKSSLTDMATGVRKRASAWGGAIMSVTGDGAAVASGAFDGQMGTGVSLAIGALGDGSQTWFGTIKNVRIWQVQLSDVALQVLTT